MDTSFLDKADTYSILMSALYASTKDPSYLLLSDLIFVLDEKNLKKFLTLFEGQTITVPSIDELNKMLIALSLYAYCDIDGIPINEVLKILKISYIPKEYKDLKKHIKNKEINIGSNFSEIVGKK